VVAVIAAAASLGGCAQINPLGDNGLGLMAQSTQPEAPAESQSELQKATDHWGKEFEKDPRNSTKAVNYARNLKAMGQKQKAFQVLQEAMLFSGSDKSVASEFGRLAIDFDQLSAAQKALEIADDPMKPDWKVISARGAVLARQGNYKDAVTFLERAMTLAPNEYSVVNNLGLALTMNGEAARGEELLRKAAEMKASGRVQQNLVIALGAQGKHDEAQEVATRQGTDGAAVANAEVMRQMVKTAPRVAVAAARPANAAPTAANWTATVTSRSRGTGDASAKVASTTSGKTDAAPALFKPSQQ